MKNILYLSSLIFFISCANKLKADLLVKNATIYTVNENFDLAEAFVIKDGKVEDVGRLQELEKKYEFSEIYDANHQTIIPGIIDAHAHLMYLGTSLQQVDLTGTNSYQEELKSALDFQKQNKTTYLIGRGWDQNDWEIKKFPTKKELDSLFPNLPVSLERIDGHAMIVNTKALNLANINSKTKVPGGKVMLMEGEPSGILIDAPMQLVWNTYPKQDKNFYIKALKDAENKCLSLGLTTVDEAGTDRSTIALMDSLQKTGDMVLRIYAMITKDKKDLNYFLTKGIVKTDRMHVRSVKIWADGSLGSRGAAMREHYSDQDGHHGTMITSEKELDSLAEIIAKADYQMNTHAIGDSANSTVLRVYTKSLKNIKDPRWRVEHAQIVTPKDFNYFSRKIIPSIQPTHATSDMYWVKDRIGSDRMEGSYSYKTLLGKSGLVALGTDFPIETVNPMLTFYAAITRKDLKDYPEKGFRMEEGLTREETLKGMTIWAAYSNFEEKEKGSIEKGKLADFIVLDHNIMTVPPKEIPTIKVVANFINGKMVFDRSTSNY
ncbi:MAG: amidohydrolase [Flavobacteriaceae bacterium]|nr:amidohydrolase [Flavobacteriaceae bacterium]